MLATVWAMESTHSGRGAYWDAFSRKSDRARSRWTWDLEGAKVVDGGPIRAGSGDITNEPIWHLSRRILRFAQEVRFAQE